MSGIFWHIFTFSIAVTFLVLMAYRIFSIRRQPVHLRWELAPVPHEKGKSKYGGSYLEEYEWWNKKRRKSLTGPFLYMAKEIFLLKGVWENNRSLWPFSYSMHLGIYFFILTFVLYLITGLLLAAEAQASAVNTLQDITAFFSAAAYVIGSLGALGLILKRVIDVSLRNFSSFSTFFRLLFLGAVFISGAVAFFTVRDFPLEISSYVKGLITLDDGVNVALIPAVHIIIVLLFVLYLPLTDMVHFITKYFTYHAVRWDDEPQDEKMRKKINGLVNQPVEWSAAHVASDGKRNWKDTVRGDSVEKEKSETV